MIISTTELSMAEAVEYVDKKDEQGAKAIAFIKKFTDTDVKNAKDMRKKLRELNMIKLNEQNITKIIDMLPENAEEINKILLSANLDEDETKKIIDIVKQFK
jgi:DNA-directed RNA polymerase subunit F